MCLLFTIPSGYFYLFAFYFFLVRILIYFNSSSNKVTLELHQFLFIVKFEINFDYSNDTKEEIK